MQATDIRFVCPPSRAMLTVTDRFALDVIEFVDMSNQRYRTEDGKHNCGNGIKAAMFGIRFPPVHHIISPRSNL